MEILSKEVKTYVVFKPCNPFKEKDLVVEVQSREIEKLDIPENCSSCQFFDRIVIEVDFNCRLIETVSERLNESAITELNRPRIQPHIDD